MRVVFDTNALLGAALKPYGNAGVTFYACEKMRYRICISNHLIKEMQRALKEDFKFSDRDVQRTVNRIKDCCTIVKPKPVRVNRISPADCIVLGTCLAAEADYLVTYDGDLLNLKRFRHTRIERPEELRKTLFKEGS